MKFLIRIIFSILITAIIVSCGEDRTYQYMELTEETQWIYSQMKENYFWSDSIKKPGQKEYFTTPSKFFASLLYREDNVSFFADSASATSYGISFAMMRDPLNIEHSRYYALVLYVEPGSPADVAGIKRGTWIYSADNKTLSTSKQDVLIKGQGTTLSTRYIEQDDETMEYKWVDSDTLAIGAATEIEQKALYLDSVYNVRDKKIGYVVCNRFDDDEFANKMSDVFTKFQAEGIDNLIIDLRYNSGGSMQIATKIASMLVPAEKTGAMFGYIGYNSNNQELNTEYRYEQVATSLDVEKIYIFATANTSGTAEAFISALKTALGNDKVIIIGETTAGDNLYTSPIESPYGFTINPAVAHLYSSNGVMLSPNGVFCDYTVDELDQIHAIYQLGELQEYMLYSATYLISTGTIPSSNMTNLPEHKRYLSDCRKSVAK